MTKKQTIVQIAAHMSFDDIYSKMNKAKIHRDTLQADITALVKTRNGVDSQVSRFNQIALAKRRAIVNKK